MSRLKGRVLSMLCVTGFILSSCQTIPGYEVGGQKDDMKYPGRELDYIAQSLDQFGSITISGTTLIDPDPRFMLDLDMTAKEMFERTRLEGFSTILQQDHLDAQLSVEAQVVQQMLQETASSISPSETSQLSQKVQAAAWRSLLAQVPGGAEIAEAFQTSAVQAKSSETATASGGTGGGEFLGDGGQAALSNARLNLDQSNTHLNKAKELCSAVSDKKEGEYGADVSTAVDQMISEADLYHAAVGDTLSNIDSGIREALYLAYEVDKRINSAPETLKTSILSFQTLVNNAKTKAAAAEAMRKTIADTLTAKQKEFAEKVKPETVSDLSTAQKKTSDAKAILDTEYKLDDTIKEAKAAADDAVAAARAVQLPVTPSVPILEAKEIEKAKRLAMSRLLPSDKLPVLTDTKDALGLNLRQLLLLTASDKSTLEMLRWLSYPQAYGPGKRIYLCMTTVSCMPGNRSLTGFRGQVDLLLQLARVEPDYKSGKDKVTFLDSCPLVFCAYPLIDSQVLDLRTSRRTTLTAAMQLAVTGYPKAANALLDFASSRDQNIETLTGVNTVTNFGSGNHVGFTFSPKLRAQADPAKVNTKPNWILDMQTFPAIIMIVIDEKDLIMNNPESGANTLVWRQNYRWMPVGKTNFGLLNRPVFSESELGRRAELLEDANTSLRNGLNDKGVPTSFAAETLEKRIEYFKTMALGQDVYMSLPFFDDEERSTCGIGEMDVEPGLVWHDASTTLTVRLPEGWKGFTEVTVAGKPVNAVQLSPRVLRVTVPPIGELVDIKAKGVEGELRELTPGIVVSNGVGVLKKTLKVARLNPVAEPKKPAPEPAPAAASPGTGITGLAGAQNVGYVDSPAAINLGELGREQRFVIKLLKPLKNSAGEPVTSGKLKYSGPSNEVMECPAIVTEKEIQQKNPFKRTGDATYDPADVSKFFGKDPVSLSFIYSEKDQTQVPKGIIGSVRFYKD